ncbi:hypothetical protein B0T25DRAFT_174383 [Lasiosphaeria hispida]|uniref:AIG1-type G domain-containing protein n=1 Tax=Lasiosphaeria hispida TaxID=260671 RepID=A0AAJ0HND7_9PEZI|nr:hypothetical protein B0T25DRAFT_174383 [Lasiosphaeria hispida]
MASSNVVILLVGLHGAGKSTFTRAATGRDDIELGRGVAPCTETCSTYSFNHAVTMEHGLYSKDSKFTIIDTPGLADRNTTEQNLEVLQVIANQLRHLGQERVSGVIYFHSIEGVRLHGVDMANIRLLKAICGAPFFPRVAFVTTRWDRMRDSDYEMLMKRNTELEGARKDLLPDGPEIFRFLNDGKSHQPVLEYFARKGNIAAQPPLLFAQELELYRQRKLKSAVKKTTAGKQVTTRRKVRKGGGGICSFL